MASVLVSGANKGIGLELCRQLSRRGDRVIATCRGDSPDLDSLDVRVVRGIDVAQDDSVDQLARALEGEPLDTLINNAGILSVESLERMDFDRIRAQFEVNTLGPLRVTRALLPNLRRGSRVAILTSLMGSLADNGSGGYYGYRISKSAVNMVGVNLARDLRGRGISVVLLHPGMVATEMTDGAGISPAESVAGLIARIDGLTLDDTGSFWHANGQRLPW
jgi:NAD(P)-dependent dehydrogenase (short-subunit alcohol dehydrogenase family)